MLICTKYIKLWGKEHYLELHTAKYADGEPALVVLGESEPFGRLSINIPEYKDFLGKNEFFIKTWSENEAWCLVFYPCFEYTGRTVPCGFANAPIWQLKKAFRKET